MRRGRLLLLLLVLIPFAWVATTETGPEPGAIPTELEDDPFAPAALAERMARVRPLVEELVGQSLGRPVPLFVADIEEYAAHAAAHAIPLIPKDKLPEDRTSLWYLLMAHHQARVPAGCVFWNDDGIWIVAETFDAASSPGYLDVLLAHELVHVHQHRQLGFDPEVTTDNERRLVRTAVVEGHAQWVARRVASRLGYDEVFDGMLRPVYEHRHEVPSDPAYGHQLVEHAVESRFEYEQGEVFFDAIVSALGYEQAIERVQAGPPRSFQEIYHPETWLDRKLRAAPPAGHRLHLLLELKQEGEEGVLLPLLAHELHGSGQGDGVVANVLRATRVSCEARGGLLQGVGGTLQVVDCVSPEVADSFVRASVASARSGTDVWDVLGRHHAIVQADLSVWGKDDRQGHMGRLILRGSLEAPVPAAFLMLRRESRVVSLVLADEDVGADLGRLARRMWYLSAPAIAPARGDGHWTNRLAGLEPASPAERRRVLLGALDDPDADMRVAALLSLQAGKELRSDDAHLHRALNDPDREVRLHAATALGQANRDDDAVPHLLEFLNAEDPGLRLVGARALGELEDRAEVVAGLERALADDDARVRLRALQSLVALEVTPVVTPKVLRRLAGDADDRIRRQVLAHIHGELDSDSAVYKQLVTAAARDPSVRVRMAAVGYWGAPDDTLIRALRDDEACVRSAALMRLTLGSITGRAAPDEDVLAALEDGLRDPHPQIRLNAVGVVGTLDEDRWRFVPELLASLDTWWLRSSAVAALGHESVRSPENVDLLCRLIRGRKCRAAAAKAIVKMGAPTWRAVPLLESLLESQHPTTKIAAARALRAHGESSEALTDVVLPILQHFDFMHRRKAIEALGDVSRRNFSRAKYNRQRRDASEQVRKQALAAWRNREVRPPRVISALQRLLADAAPEVRAKAVEVLDDIDGNNPVSLRAIVQLFDDPSAHVRYEVRDSLRYSAADLEKIVYPAVREVLKTGRSERHGQAALFLYDGEDASPLLVPGLLQVLADPDDPERVTAAGALAEITPRASEAIGPLIAVLEDSDEDLRTAAVESLVAMAPVAPTTMKAILSAFRKERSEEARGSYYDALLKNANDAAEIVPYLTELLRGGDPWELRRASELLGAIGPAAKAAIPALEAARQHRDVHVGDAAKSALVAIRGG